MITSRASIEKQQKIEPFWWKVPFAEDGEDSEVHKSVFPHVIALEEEQKDIQLLHVRNSVLYSNDNVTNFGRTLKTVEAPSKPVGRSAYNVIQQSVDTATAMIAKNRPKAAFLTDGGDYELQLKSELLDKFVYGVFESSGLYDECIRVFEDGAWSGTGALKIFAEDDRIKAERVLIDEIIVDQRECRYGKPRQLHQRRFVHAETLKEQFPEHAELIAKANKDAKKPYASFHKLGELVAVVESWYLASRPGKNNGRHTITISNCTLLDEKYDDDDYPFIFCRWHNRITGFYGVGIAERLTGIQLRINQLLRFIDRMQTLMSKPILFMEAGGAQKLQLINNKGDVVVIPYTGRQPSFYTPTAVSVEIYQYVAQLKQEAFELEGISRMQAHMQKPQDLESGKALREWHDMGADRQSLQAISYANLFKEAAFKIVKLSKKIYGDNEKFTTIFQAKTFVQRIDWSEVDMDADAFVIKVDISSLNARTPAGRTQDVIDMLQSGLISPAQGRRLLDHLDIERDSDLSNAAIENIERTIWNLRRGKYSSPEPFQNLKLGLAMVQEAYLMTRDQEAPEDILELFRKWMENAEGLQQKALQKAQEQQAAMAAAQQPPMPPPMGVPPGMEGMPPPEMMPPEMGMPPQGVPPEMAMAA